MVSFMSKTPDKTAALLQQVWTSGFLRCRSKDLEPFTRPFSSIAQLRLHQINTEGFPLHNAPQHGPQ